MKHLKAIKAVELSLLLLLCAVVPLFVARIALYPDTRQVVFRVLYLPFWAYGFLVGILLCGLHFVKATYLKNAKLLFTLPAFALLALFSYPIDRANTAASVSVPFQFPQIAPNHLSLFRPIFGFCTEFILGIVVAVLLCAAIQNRKQINSFLLQGYRWKQLLLLAVFPVLLGYLDVWHTLLREWLAQRDMASLPLTTVGPVSFTPWQLLTQSKYLPIILLFVIVAFALWFIVGTVELHKITALCFLIVGIVCAAEVYLALLPTAMLEQSQFLRFIVGSTTTVIAPPAAVLSVVGLKGLLHQQSRKLDA